MLAAQDLGAAPLFVLPGDRGRRAGAAARGRHRAAARLVRPARRRRGRPRRRGPADPRRRARRAAPGRRASWPTPPTSRPPPPTALDERVRGGVPGRPAAPSSRALQDGAAAPRRGARPLAGVRRHRRVLAHPGGPGRPAARPGGRRRHRPAGARPPSCADGASSRSWSPCCAGSPRDAAEQAYTGVAGAPGRAPALLDPALARPGADLAERAERLVRDWQRGVLELVRAEGGDKRFVARTAAYAVNATGLAVMIAVFASTAFIPTGLEVAAGAGTTVAAQKVLEAIFGDQAVRTLAARARADLLDRVDALLDEEAARYLRTASRRRRSRPRTPAPACAQAAAAVGAGPARAAACRRPRRSRHARRRAGPVSDIAGRVRDALRGDQRVDADAAARPPRGAAPLPATPSTATCRTTGSVAAHTLVERAGARLALSRDHTVVALAGATGSGKSSLFNALARLELSPVGVRRPTTGVAHACVWGPLERRQPAARLDRRAAPAPLRPGERARRRRRGGPARPGPARPARLRLGAAVAPAGGGPAARPGRPGRLGGRPAEVRRPGGARQLPARVPPAPRRHRRGAQPGRPAVPGRAAAGPGRPAPAARRRRADRRAGAGHLGARPGRRWPELRAALERTVAERQAALRRLAGDLDAVVDRPGRRWSAARPPAADRRPPTDRGSTGRSPAPPGCRRWPRRCERRTGTGPARPPAGRWSAAGAGCARTRCAGCTCPAGDAAPTRPTRRRAWSRRPRCRMPTAAQRSAVGLAVRAVADRAAAGLPAPGRPR